MLFVEKRGSVLSAFLQLRKAFQFPSAVHPDHPQQEDHEHRARTLRRDHAGAGDFEAGVGAIRRGITGV